jgi:hypothetical protein
VNGLDRNRSDLIHQRKEEYRDGALRQANAEDTLEGLEDVIEGVTRIGVVGRIRGRREEGLAALGLLLFGEGGVVLDGADGGDEVAPNPGGGGGVAGAVGAAPGSGVGEGWGFGEAWGVPGCGAGGAAEKVDLGRGGDVADHADAVTVAGKVRHGGGGGGRGLGFTRKERGGGGER